MTLTLEQIALYEERLSRGTYFDGHSDTTAHAVYWVLRDMLTNEKMRLEEEEKLRDELAAIAEEK